MLILISNKEELESPKFSEAEEKELSKMGKSQMNQRDGNFLLGDSYLIS